MDTQTNSFPEVDLLFGGSPALQRVLANFNRAADVVGLDENIAVRLRRPDKVLIVALPVTMDDGSVQVFTGFRVQHNHALGPYKGGTRYHPEVDLGEVSALAIQMTWKTALTNLPLGGAKGAVRVDPYQLSHNEIQQLTRRYAAEIAPIIGPEVDIPAPDMGTDERTMAWFMDTYTQRTGKFTPQIVTGKPVDVGGSILRREATGRGVVYTTEEAAQEIGLSLKNATIALHGFGNVGSYAAQEFVRRGAKIIAVADVSGGYINRSGFNVDELLGHIARNRTLDGYADAEHVDAHEVLEVPCDILVPAATGQVISAENAGRVRCKIIAEGANGPTMPEADAILERNGVFMVPDTLCNAGGVVVSYFEWVQGGMNFFWSEEEIDSRLSRILREAYHRVRQFAKARQVPTRIAALAVAIDRVAKSMQLRGFYG